MLCLGSKDYMQIRNALIILMRILPTFPVLSKLAQILEKHVMRVVEEEKNHRQDLFVLATSYIGQLKSKSNEMIKEADFHQMCDKPAKSTADLLNVVNGNGTSAANNHGKRALILFVTKSAKSRSISNRKCLIYSRRKGRARA